MHFEMFFRRRESNVLCRHRFGTVKNNQERRRIIRIERLRRLRQVITNALRLYAAVRWPRLHSKYINEFMILADP